MIDNASVYMAILVLVAALLGALLGFACSRLFDRPRYVAAVREAERKRQEVVDKTTVRIHELERERETSLADKLQWSEQESELKNQHAALRSHTQSQHNRIEALLAEQLSSEEHQARLEQQVLALRQELGMAEHDQVMALSASEVDGDFDLIDDLESEQVNSPDIEELLQDNVDTKDGFVPVLNRRVDSRKRSRRERRHPASAASAAELEQLLAEGDIPVLAESDLPDLLDTSEWEDLVDDR